jgi:Dolichyl-phosphate-mannose-protein mannosyltransferase
LTRFVAATLITYPSIFTDELTYWSLARSFHHGGHFLVFNLPSDIPAQLYPILLSPLFGMGDNNTAYILVKLVSCLMLCAVVFPAYFLAREIATEREAMCVAVLSLLAPGGVYTATVMAENLFYPAFVLGAWLAFRTLLHGRIRDAVLAGAAFALGFYVKPHILFLMAGYGLALVIWLATNWFAQASGARNFRLPLSGAARRCLPFVVFACGLVFRSSEIGKGGGYAHSLALLLAGEAYAGTVQLGNHHLPLGPFVHSAAWLVLVFAISIALVPLLAAVAAAFRLTRLSDTQRWFWVFLVCVGCVFLFMITRHNVLNDGTLRTHERYVFELSPLFFASYFSFRKQLPRRTLLLAGTFMVVGGAAVLAYASPHLLNFNESSDSPTLTGLLWIYLRNPHAQARWWIFVAVLIGGLICLLASLSRRSLRTVVLAWAAVLIAYNVGAYGFHLKVMGPDERGYNELGLYFKAEFAPYTRIGFLEDNADLRVGWYGDFWWSGPFCFYRRDLSAGDWFAVSVKDRPDGTLDFGGVSPEVLLASDTVQLPYPVIHVIRTMHIRVYRIANYAEAR